MIDLDYLYAHHAVGLCPEERCVAARANLAALGEERDELRGAITAFFDFYEVDDYEGLGMPEEGLWAAVQHDPLQGRVASREGSGTP